MLLYEHTFILSLSLGPNPPHAHARSPRPGMVDPSAHPPIQNPPQMSLKPPKENFGGVELILSVPGWEIHKPHPKTHSLGWTLWFSAKK